MLDKIISLNNETSADISENFIREKMPEILELLLIDRTKSTKKTTKNIIWANNNYTKHSARYYAPTAQIKPALITGKMECLIMPRALKSQEIQKERTRSKAEVFTPTWIVKKQNDAAEQDYLNDDLKTYISRTWLEITCGEAPYMATRYDMGTGKILPINEREGFIDRKLKRISSEVNDKSEWHTLAVLAYQASYGFEWNGDPLSDTETVASELQPDLFGDETPLQVTVRTNGKRVKIMNWRTQKMEFFDKEINT